MIALLQYNEEITGNILQEWLLSAASVEFPSGFLSLPTNPQGSWKKNKTCSKTCLQSTGIPVKESLGGYGARGCEGTPFHSSLSA